MLLVNVHALHRISKYKDKEERTAENLAGIGRLAADEAEHEKGGGTSPAS